MKPPHAVLGGGPAERSFQPCGDLACTCMGAIARPIPLLRFRVPDVRQAFWHTTRSHTADNPRIRIFVLLREPIKAELYDAVARVFGHKLDRTMETIDPVSFRLSQLMYLPSTSKNGEFDCGRNKGKLLDAKTLLRDFPGDWQDYTQLPFSESRGMQRPSAKKAENPLEKPGIIGAFCRAYDVEEAIAEFLPDVYGLENHKDFAIASEDEPMGVPVEVCLPQIYVECLGGDMSRYASNQMLAQKIGAALREVPGWRFSGGRKRFPKWGNQRTFIRTDTNLEERTAGYRLVQGWAGGEASDDSLI